MTLKTALIVFYALVVSFGVSAQTVTVYKGRYGTSAPIVHITDNVIYKGRYGSSEPIAHITDGVIYKGRYGASEPIAHVTDGVIYKGRYGTSEPIAHLTDNVIYKGRYGASEPVAHIEGELTPTQREGKILTWRKSLRRWISTRSGWRNGSEEPWKLWPKIRRSQSWQAAPTAPKHRTKIRSNIQSAG
jgi:hypothetical protein